VLIKQLDQIRANMDTQSAAVLAVAEADVTAEAVALELDCTRSVVESYEDCLVAS
jgi:hypothetical protein